MISLSEVAPSNADIPMLVSCCVLNDALSSFTQFINALSPISARFALSVPNSTEIISAQPANAFLSILATLSGIMIFGSFTQFSKAFLPMSVNTPSVARFAFTSEVIPPKARTPIFSTVTARVISVTFIQPSNEWSATELPDVTLTCLSDWGTDV